MMPTTNQEPPIADPVVTVQGRQYTVVYSFRAEFKCSEWNLNPLELLKVLLNYKPHLLPDGSTELNPDGSVKMVLQPDNRHLFYTYSLFAACVAHNFVNEIAWTAEQWAEKIGENDPVLFAQIVTSLYVALGKRLRERNARRPQPAAMTPEVSTSAPN